MRRTWRSRLKSMRVKSHRISDPSAEAARRALPMQHADDGDGGGVAVAAPPPAAVAAAASQRAEAGLTPGEIVAGKWRLQARIGRGAFGDIFVATALTSEDAQHQQPQTEARRYAIKLEKLPMPAAGEDREPLDEKAQAALAARAVLKLEAVILSKLQRYPFVGRFIEYGRDMTLGVAYLVMSLLGENLLRLRRRREGGKFSLPTVLRFGVQALRAIQAVHEIGFLHRDIKPSNFVIGSNRGTLHAAQTGVTSPLTDTGGSDIEMELMSPSKIAIIDFGLARAFRDRATGTVLPSRGNIKGFRGTPRYASVHVHREEDLSRRDDLWSLLYILVEFCTGDLPWGSKRDKDDIGAIKEKFLSLRLLKTGQPGEIPSCFVPFMQHLYSLKFESKPNYAYLIELLQRKLAKLGFAGCEGPDASTLVGVDGVAVISPTAHTTQPQGEECPFDWEDTSILNTLHDGSLSVGERTTHTQGAVAAPVQIKVDRVQATSSEGELASRGRGGELDDATPSPVPQPVLPLHDGSTSGLGGTTGPGLQPQTPSLVAPALATSAPLPHLSPSSSMVMQPDSASSLQLQMCSALPPSAVAAAASSSPSPSSAVQLLSGAAFPSLPLPAAGPLPAFGALPLSQPIPLPQTLLLSPRKQLSRGTSDVPASPLLPAALGPPAAASAIALPLAAAVKQRSKLGVSSSAFSSSAASSSVAASSSAAVAASGNSSSSSVSSFALKPPRHSAHSALHISVAGGSNQPGPSPSPSTVLLAAIASPSPISLRSASGAANNLSAQLESDDQRADMNKQRTSFVWGEDQSGAQLSSRMPGASPSPIAAEFNGAAADVDPDAAAEADAMPDWGGFITPRGPPDRSVSVSHSERARLAVEPIHEEEQEDVHTHRTRSTAAASDAATDDELAEGGGGDGRTLAPATSIGAADGGFDGNPAHSLNDACIHTHSLHGVGMGGAGGPDQSSHAPGFAQDADTLHWRDEELPRSTSGNPPPTASSRGRSRSEVAPGAAGLCLLPSTSPHATPQRRVVGSMLLQDSDDSSSDATSSSEGEGSPRPRLMAALEAAAGGADNSAIIAPAVTVSSPPRPIRSSQLNNSASVSLASVASSAPQPLPLPVAAPLPLSDSTAEGGFGVVWQNLGGDAALPAWTSTLALEVPSSADTSLAAAHSIQPTVAAATAAETVPSAFPAASVSASSVGASGVRLTAPHSRSPSLSGALPLRPQPPSAPAPAYSARDRSFGRFHRGVAGRAERSPAKPLSGAIAQRIVEQQAEAAAAAAAAEALPSTAPPSASGSS